MGLLSTKTKQHGDFTGELALSSATRSRVPAANVHVAHGGHRPRGATSAWMGHDTFRLLNFWPLGPDRIRRGES